MRATFYTVRIIEPADESFAGKLTTCACAPPPSPPPSSPLELHGGAQRWHEQIIMRTNDANNAARNSGKNTDKIAAQLGTDRGGHARTHSRTRIARKTPLVPGERGMAVAGGAVALANVGYYATVEQTCTPHKRSNPDIPTARATKRCFGSATTIGFPPCTRTHTHSRTRLPLSVTL